MRTGKRIKLHILLLTVCLLLAAWPAYAKNEEPEPLTLTVEADPTCLLSEAGEMTFFRFKVKNNLNEEYVLEDMSLQGDILSAPKLISNRITIKANDVLEFTLENVRIEDFMFDMDLSFQLTWWTTSYTLDGLEKGQNSNYATAATVTQDEIEWSVMGNLTQDGGWRIGGKNLSDTNREIYSESKLEAEISKVELV